MDSFYAKNAAWSRIKKIGELNLDNSMHLSMEFTLGQRDAMSDMERY
jgi:hypothetical protein